MTKKLEELFNLSQNEEKSEELELPPDTQDITLNALNNLEKIENGTAR